MNPPKELKVIFITVRTSQTLYTKWLSNLYSSSSLNWGQSRPCSPTTPCPTTTPWSGMPTQVSTRHRRSWARSCPGSRTPSTWASYTAGMWCVTLTKGPFSSSAYFDQTREGIIRWDDSVAGGGHQTRHLHVHGIHLSGAGGCAQHFHTGGFIKIKCYPMQCQKYHVKC